MSRHLKHKTSSRSNSLCNTMDCMAYRCQSITPLISSICQNRPFCNGSRQCENMLLSLRCGSRRHFESLWLISYYFHSIKLSSEQIPCNFYKQYDWTSAQMKGYWNRISFYLKHLKIFFKFPRLPYLINVRKSWKSWC